MYLLFDLGHPDVMPTLDLGVKKGIAYHFEVKDLKKVTPSEMVRLTDHWKVCLSYIYSEFHVLRLYTSHLYSPTEALGHG